ncbi:RHS repeat-associated core domain-containing protein [Akkermansia muciniphila]|uniref:RHS repeat-associated core domain-containing protein n=1 Tax=Akkermansia muciniphila TaxID=239935 RepID=UPI000FE15BCF|nr:RHS repeat-associated core domain-containing protein [Akkermansia muciniphila]QAA57344.1 sugar-binding protein [Akkermansia muciniphila]QAA59653.1 sugar-binding protein [Akkermansia muciniphila]
MNPPHRSSSVHRSAVPGYRKWYFGAGGSPGRRGMEAAPEPDPLPFEEIHEHAEITVGPPSTSADGYSAHGTFTIPEGAEGKKLYGTCSLFLGVDDWGILEVKDSGGNVVAQVDLKENPQTAGEQGGHKYHTGTGGAQLPSGTYSWEVSQTNIDYNPASGNTSICNYSIDVVPTEPGGRKEPEPCPCEGDTCDNSGGTPPSPSLARSGPEAGMESGALGNYSSAGCSVTAESGRRITRYTYACSGEADFSNEPATETADLLPLEGHVKTLTSTTWKYTTANHIKRTERRVTGLGVAGTRLTAEEQWLAGAANIHARGRTRFSRDLDGVQTWHDYAATTEHGALYTETVETRINGEAVPGQSTRAVTWITAEGQRVREENYLLLSTGQWALTGSAVYEFDTQNRWVKRTAGNGRLTERELMCDGGLLWEIDENGIRTDYAYDTARQLVEVTRSAVMDGETVITPETITTYARDAAGRVLSTRRDTGAMTTQESAIYDLLGRTVSVTDVLGRVTAYAYSGDGLTATRTAPSGATFVTRSAPDGTVMEESGTGQRHVIYAIDLVNDGVRTFTKAVSGETETELQRSIVNGAGETLRTGIPNTVGGVIYTRRTYNAKGQLVKEQADAGNAATAMAPTLWEYDAFGNRTKETWKLADPATVSNSRITTWSYGAEQAEDGVYQVVTATRNNGRGTTCDETQKTLLSSLSPTLESKVISIDPRGNASEQWSEYGPGAVRTQKSSIPTSNVIATATVIDGFTTTQTDHAGVTATQTRAYTETGVIYANTDGRGNTVTTRTDLAGRTVSVTDAAGNTTSTAYGPWFDQPAVVTNALGNTTCYGYDLRGRNTAQWGTGTQPLLFAYDEADRMTSLTTFREDAGDITTDPTGRTDGDVTTWSYDDATGLLIRKTWADGTHEDTTYNALNLRSTLTDARGVVTTWGYNLKKGVNNSVSYSDSTPGIQYAYNHLNQLTQVTDASGTRVLTYTPYNEPDTDAITIEGVSCQLQEHYDTYGRSSGYTLKQGTGVLQEVSQGYEADGRLASAGIMHGGTEQRFAYGYLAGSSLLSSLAMPDGIVRELSYEQRRDLLSGIDCRLGETVLVSRTQRCDALERPVTRTQRRGTEPAHSDSFSYNGRNELTGAALGAAPYGYSYDNIGNRKTAQEPAQELAYAANGLNQYTGIEESGEAPFVPTYDASGNQTLIKTSTGVWTVVYNAANRAVSFTSRDGATVVECGYDYLGRRYMKKVTQNGTVASHERYLYRGYLQIAALDMLDNRNVLRTLLWDPLEPVATRPLALVQDASLYCYGVDFNKNVSEVFDREGAVAAIYDYSPYGTATRTGRLVQPVQWSAEMHDDDLALVYYNYRYYNPRDGRWINRDPIAEQGGWNSYSFVGNNPIDSFDINGQNAMARAVPFAAGAAAVDGLLPIGDVIGAIVIVSAGAYDLSQPGPGTGNCTRLFHGMLQSAVNAAKIETALLGKCKDTDCCWLLKIKAATWLKNAIARDTINSKCYQGGDSGHRKASEQAWTNVINCQRKIKIKCNG